MSLIGPEGRRPDKYSALVINTVRPTYSGRPNQVGGLVRRFTGSQSIPWVTLQYHHHMSLIGPEGHCRRAEGPTSTLWTSELVINTVRSTYCGRPNQAEGLVRRFTGSQSIPWVTLQHHHHMVAYWYSKFSKLIKKIKKGYKGTWKKS